MSSVVRISSAFGKVALTDERIKSLEEEIPELQHENGLIRWMSVDGRELYFNIEPNELWSDAIDEDEDYELVEKIADHLGFVIHVEDEQVLEDEVSGGSVGVLGVLVGIAVGIFTLIVFVLGLLLLPFRLLVALIKK